MGKSAGENRMELARKLTLANEDQDIGKLTYELLSAATSLSVPIDPFITEHITRRGNNEETREIISIFIQGFANKKA